MDILKRIPLLIVGLVIVALTCSTLPLNLSSGITNTSAPPPTPVPTTEPPVATGDCNNVGLDYSANPFRGWPTAVPNWGVVTAYYCSLAYYAMFGVNHYGIDLGYPTGTSVYATASGAVANAGWHPLMGLHVIVCTPTNWCAVYMHLSELSVAQWDGVAPGTELGKIGSTGNSTGPHLHYEIRHPDGTRIDPSVAMR